MTVTEISPALTAPPRKRTRRKPVKQATIWVHRWSSFVLGILLLMVTTSGALVVYTPEWLTWTNSAVFSTTSSQSPVSVATAIDIVKAAHPDFAPGSVNVYDGLYEVMSSDGEAHPGFYGVDPGTGRITGFADADRGVMAFFNQVHECFFTCEDYPGYVSFLNAKVPTLGMSWLKEVTWGAFALGVMGMFLVFLGLTGIWLWWPGIKRWTHGFRVRMHKGRYARDYDLHQVIGMAAAPFLLMWGLTGAGYEFGWVGTAWYAVTGGSEQPESTFTSAEVKNPKTPDVSMAQALDAAQKVAGPSATVAYAAVPAAGDATSTYSFYFSRGFDQYAHGAYPGEYGVNVDRHDATRTSVEDLGHAETLSNRLYDSWNAPMLHYGQSVNGWWRLAWFGFGLTPLVLAVTGISTALAKRSVRKRRAAARSAAIAEVA